METYSQRDKRWANIKLGFGTVTIGSDGCYLTCLSMMDGRTPDVLNEVLKKAGAFKGALLISDVAAKALGMQFTGIEYDIKKEPDYFPNIKEVDMSPAPNKQQHFVVRIMENGKKKILDPWTGKVEPLSKYPFVSYRKFKVKEVTCTHCLIHCPK